MLKEAAGADNLSEIFPGLGKADQQAMDGFRDIISNGYTLCSDMQKPLEKELARIKWAQERVGTHTEEDIKTILSLDPNDFSDKKWRLVRKVA